MLLPSPVLIAQFLPDFDTPNYLEKKQDEENRSIHEQVMSLVDSLTHSTEPKRMLKNNGTVPHDHAQQAGEAALRWLLPNRNSQRQLLTPAQRAS